ncbi:MAG: diaminopimelate decarboxylase [Clostridia bacterium]|nr:diaminopimelate decarboxylase [Clostridia bacterium]
MPDYAKIVSEFGTPLYLFDINVLSDRIAYLNSKFSDNTALVYAVKANSFIPKEIENDVARFEICSKGEFDICNSLGINRNKMVISGVYKDRPSIEEMISKYSDVLKYTVESLNQYELLKEMANRYNRTLHLLIRLTSGNQFGVNKEEFRQIIKEHPVNIIIDGIEYFSGTQKYSLKKIAREIGNLYEFVTEVEQETGFSLGEIEYGPGAPVFYFKDESFDEEEYLSELNAQLSVFKDKKVYIELGRSIAAGCGTYFTSVVDMKTNKNGNFVILDGGINHLVYYGQTMAMRIPYFDLYPDRKGDEETYTLYGSLCTVNDIIVKSINVRKLMLGDIFAFKNVGAYSVTEGISLFLSRDLPKVVLYNRNKSATMVRDFTKTSNINYPNY